MSEEVSVRNLCPYCRRFFFNLEGHLRRMRKRMHWNIGPISYCHWCGKELSSIDDAIEHRKDCPKRLLAILGGKD